MLLNILHKDHVTNEEVPKKSKQPLENMRNSLSWSRNKNKVVLPYGLAKLIPQVILIEKRRRGRQKKRWEKNIKGWTRIDFFTSARAAEDKTRWKWVVIKSSVVTSQGYWID